MALQGKFWPLLFFLRREFSRDFKERSRESPIRSEIFLESSEILGYRNLVGPAARSWQVGSLGAPEIFLAEIFFWRNPGPAPGRYVPLEEPTRFFSPRFFSGAIWLRLAEALKLLFVSTTICGRLLFYSPLCTSQSLAANEALIMHFAFAK